MNFDVNTFNVQLYDEILSRGLSNGLGSRESNMCIEATICTVLNLPHGDDPQCVSSPVRRFKLKLNDCNWSSMQARAEGLRDLGLAQLGSRGTIDNIKFLKRLSENTIGTLLPTLIKDIFLRNEKLLALAEVCEKEKSRISALNLYDAYAADAAADAADAAAYATYAAAAADAADAAAYAADAAAYATYAAADAYAADAAAYAADAAAYAAADAYAADAAAYAADAAADAAYAAAAAADAADAKDKYLKLSAKIALDILIEMKSPGCQLLGKAA